MGGYEYCIFVCGTPDEQMPLMHEIGSDGEWAWKKSLAHYVERHSVRLPDEFVATMRTNNWRIPDDIHSPPAPRKLIGPWFLGEEMRPDPRAFESPGWYGDDLGKILSYLNMDTYRPPRAKLTGRPIHRRVGPTDLSFWRAWTAEHASPSWKGLAAGFPVVRREWLLAPVDDLEQWMSSGSQLITCQEWDPEAGGPWWVRKGLGVLRSQTDVATRRGGRLWAWRFGTCGESGHAGGLAVVEGGVVTAEWWLDPGAIPEFRDRGWVRHDGSLREPYTS